MSGGESDPAAAGMCSGEAMRGYISRNAAVAGVVVGGGGGVGNGK